jgi:NAD(P) transhydrogenase subunit beta
MNAFSWVIQLIYVASAVCFVLGLHLMNTPATARRGNQVSTAGMVAAVAATFALIIHAGVIGPAGWAIMLAGGLIGSGAGLYAARTVQMTAMPQLVSVFNAVGGGAAALVAINDYVAHASTVGETGHVLRLGHRGRQAAGDRQRSAGNLPWLAGG